MAAVAAEAAAAADADAAAALGVTELPAADGGPAGGATGDEHGLCRSYTALVKQLMQVLHTIRPLTSNLQLQTFLSGQNANHLPCSHGHIMHGTSRADSPFALSLQVLCSPVLPDAVAAARLFLPGVLQSLKPAPIGGGSSGSSPLARDPSWLTPIAQLLAPADCIAGHAANDSGRDASGSPAPDGASPAASAEKQGGKKRRRGGRRSTAQKENEGGNAAAAEPAADADAADGRQAADDAALAPAAAEAPAVKALLQAASLSKVRSELAGPALRV